MPSWVHSPVSKASAPGVRRTPELVGAGAAAVRVSLVVAVADNGVIGRGGGLPWHLPDDLKHFKRVTLGKAVLMGRRTFESIGRALPGRRNLVMSRGAASGGAAPVVSLDEVEHVGSVQEARALVARGAGGTGSTGGTGGTGGTAELCVIGGAQVYTLALPLATRIYLTQVHAAVQGDVYFPAAADAWSGMPEGWREVERTEHAADIRHAYAMSFVRLER